MQAELLRRQGYDVLAWGDSALLRAFDRLWEWEQSFGDWWGDGDSEDSAHVPALAVFWFGAERDWYLVGWCRLRGAVRAFRLDRITTVEVTGEPAPERPPPALDDGCLPGRSWRPAIVA